MYAVMRNYSGNGVKELLDFIDKNLSDLEKSMSDVSGFVSYTVIRTGTDMASSITICETEAGTEESVLAAAEWIKKNAPSFGLSPPQIWKGSVITEVKK